MKTPPERDPVGVVADKILDQVSDGKWRPTSTIATAVQVTIVEAQEALKTLRSYVVTHARGDVIEYAIPPAVANLRSTLVARDEKIAEQDLEITQLMERFTVPSLTSVP